MKTQQVLKKKWLAQLILVFFLNSLSMGSLPFVWAGDGDPYEGFLPPEEDPNTRTMAVPRDQEQPEDSSEFYDEVTELDGNNLDEFLAGDSGIRLPDDPADTGEGDTVGDGYIQPLIEPGGEGKDTESDEPGTFGTGTEAEPNTSEIAPEEAIPAQPSFFDVAVSVGKNIQAAVVGMVFNAFQAEADLNQDEVNTATVEQALKDLPKFEGIAGNEGTAAEEETVNAVNDFVKARLGGNQEAAAAFRGIAGVQQVGAMRNFTGPVANVIGFIQNVAGVLSGVGGFLLSEAGVLYSEFVGLCYDIFGEVVNTITTALNEVATLMIQTASDLNGLVADLQSTLQDALNDVLGDTLNVEDLPAADQATLEATVEADVTNFLNDAVDATDTTEGLVDTEVADAVDAVQDLPTTANLDLIDDLTLIDPDQIIQDANDQADVLTDIIQEIYYPEGSSQTLTELAELVGVDGPLLQFEEPLPPPDEAPLPPAEEPPPPLDEAPPQAGEPSLVEEPLPLEVLPFSDGYIDNWLPSPPEPADLPEPPPPPPATVIPPPEDICLICRDYLVRALADLFMGQGIVGDAAAAVARLRDRFLARTP